MRICKVMTQYDTIFTTQKKVLYLRDKELSTKCSIILFLAHPASAQAEQLLKCSVLWQGRFLNPTLHDGTLGLSLWVLCALWE